MTKTEALVSLALSLLMHRKEWRAERTTFTNIYCAVSDAAKLLKDTRASEEGAAVRELVTRCGG